MAESNDVQIQNISTIGLEAANFLVENIGEHLVYDNFIGLLFQRMEEMIDLVQIRFYVIDSERENLIEESISNNTGRLPGTGLIPVSSLSEVFVKEKTESYADNNYNYLRVLLQNGPNYWG